MGEKPPFVLFFVAYTTILSRLGIGNQDGINLLVLTIFIGVPGGGKPQHQSTFSWAHAQNLPNRAGIKFSMFDVHPPRRT